MFIAGVLITGGNPHPNSSNKVEFYDPLTGTSCPLPIIPGGGRARHSSCSTLLCGGEGSPALARSCVKITAGHISPLPSIKLRRRRRGHLCWKLPGRSWRTLTTARLPSGRTGPRAATVNNVVFLFGKNCLNVLYFIVLPQMNPGSQLGL